MAIGYRGGTDGPVTSRFRVSNNVTDGAGPRAGMTLRRDRQAVATTVTEADGLKVHNLRAAAAGTAAGALIGPGEPPGRKQTWNRKM